MSGRRTFLGRMAAGTAAVAAIVVAADPKQSLAAPVSSLAAVYARYVVAAADLKRVDRQCDEVKDAIIARCGDAKRGQLRADLWGSDPAYPEFERLFDASNDAFDRLCELLDVVEEIKARSVEDVVIKLRVALAEWEDDHPDDMPRLHVHVMKDAERFLSVGAVT